MTSDEYIAHEEVYKGYKIQIVPDPYPTDPREWDNLGTMVSFRWTDPREFLEWFKAQKDIVALPLYLLDHSGLAMSTGKFSCDPGGWDTSSIGYIYATAEAVRKEYSLKPKQKITKAIRAKVEALLEGEVEAYDRYLRGDYVGYQIYGPPPKPCDQCRHQEEPEVLESCWSFDDQKHCLEEARRVVDSMVKAEKKKKRGKRAS